MKKKRTKEEKTKMAEIVETVRERYNLRKNVAQKIDTQGQCYVNETESSDSLERERVISKEISFIKLAQNTVLVGAKRTEKIEYNKKRMDYIAIKKELYSLSFLCVIGSKNSLS